MRVLSLALRMTLASLALLLGLAAAAQAHQSLTAIVPGAYPYTAATGQRVMCDATAGARSINLPATTGSNGVVEVYKTDASANACNPVPNGSDTIAAGGATTITQRGGSIKLVDTASGKWTDTGVAPTSAGGGGTVTSVAATVPSRESVSGSPITGAGTLAITDNPQSANFMFAGPVSGGAATPGFRAMVAADLPSPTGLLNFGTSLSNSNPSSSNRNGEALVFRDGGTGHSVDDTAFGNNNGGAYVWLELGNNNEDFAIYAGGSQRFYFNSDGNFDVIRNNRGIRLDDSGGTERNGMLLDGPNVEQVGGAGVSRVNINDPITVTGQSAVTVGSCGTSPSVTAGSRTNAGEITVGSGTTTCVVNFPASSFPTKAFCTATDESTAAALQINAISASSFTVANLTATDKFMFTCLGD